MRIKAKPCKALGLPLTDLILNISQASVPDIFSNLHFTEVHVTLISVLLFSVDMRKIVWIHYQLLIF